MSTDNTSIYSTIKPIKTGAENVFILAVKEGNFVNYYNIAGVDLQDAINKGRKYCEDTGKRRKFIHVRPFISDLEKKAKDEAQTV